MARRGNKAIRATVSMKIAVSDSLLALVNNYVKALRFTLFWLKENVPNPNEKRVLGKVHEALYERLREEYNLPSKVAEDCYREALATYKGWYNNPRRGRFLRVYKEVSELSLIEAMWVIRRLLNEGTKVDFKIVKTGLKSVIKTYRLLRIPIQRILMP